MRTLAAGMGWWALGMAAGAPVWLAARRFPLHPALAAAAVAALVGAALLVLRLPAWGACALITLIYWNASDVVTDTWGFAWLLRLALAGVLGAWLLNRLLRAPAPRLRWPLLAPLLLWGGAQVLATPGAGDLAAAGARLGEFAKDFAVFYILANLLPSPRAWRWGVNALLTAVALLALPVLYQGVTGSHNPFWGFGAMVWAQIVPGQFGWRLGGALGDPNFLAMVLVAGLPLAAVQALEPRAGTLRRLLALSALGLGLGATLYTYSRAAFLGVGLLVVLLLYHPRRRWVLAALAAALVASTAAAPAALWGRLQTLATSSLTAPRQQMTDASFSDRRHEMLTGALMFLHHPLLGVGPGNYESEYLQYSALAGGGSDTRIRDPHSLYIQIAAETGLIGFAAFVWLVCAAYALMERGRRRAARLGAPNLAGLIWALEVAVAIYLLLSTFLHDAYFRHFLLLLALGGLGAALALETGAGLESRRTRRAGAGDFNHAVYSREGVRT
ncbi:MAG: O-antigen ligase family protein [Terriglobales bacterium]